MQVSGLKEHDDIAGVMLIVHCSVIFSCFFLLLLGTFTLHLCTNLSGWGGPHQLDQLTFFIVSSNCTGAAGVESPTSLAIAVKPCRSATVQHVDIKLEAKAISY